MKLIQDLLRRLNPGGRRSARRRRVAQGTSLAVVAGTLVVLAFKYDGSPIHDVNLNDGGVWVTNGNRAMMARLNSQAKELEVGIVTTSTSSAVFQEAASVEVYDDGGGNPERSVMRADPVTGTAVPVPLPGTFEASAGRDTVAITDDKDGRVWIKRADQLEGFNDTTPAAFTVSPRSGVVVSKTGTALVSDRRDGKVTAWRLDQTGSPVKGESFDFDTEFTDDAVLSAVGETPVVLQAGELLRPGEDAVKVDGDDAVLQQPGPEADTVAVATTTALWRADLSGGDPKKVSTLSVEGAPAAPAVVAGCVHAAWNAPGTANYERLCGDAPAVTGEIKPLDSSSQLVFRSNRDVVVLNDVVNGSAWMVQESGLTLVDNWESVDPNAKDPQIAEANDEHTTRRNNQPPTAVDDDKFGVRPGATVILPVTLNDIDPDGDIITLTKPPTSAGGTTYSVVGDGTQVQAKVAPNARGSVEFDYEINDGRDQHTPSSATVTLNIHPAGTDTAPKMLPKQTNKLRVASGHSASVNVLPSWYDPEGDAMVLTSASVDDGDGEVGFRPDGTIDFTDSGDGPGAKSIKFTLSGGAATATGTVAVTVVAEKKAAPTAVADHFTGLVGTTILLDPLRNDNDPLGGQLSLPQMRTIDGGPARINRDSTRGTATFRADQHGTYYLSYVAGSANGQVSEPTLVRVDVRPRTGTNRPPIATRDTAAVRSSGSALVDVLANDADPDGDVMVVQGVEVPAAWADMVKVSLINKRFVRVEAVRPFDGKQPQFDYLLSDGRSDQVRGTVAVTESKENKNRRPVAVEDVVTARAGTIVSVPVTENDSDPDGDKLTVDQQDLFDVSDRAVIKDGTIPVVATGSSIRVLVPDDGTTQIQIGYGVRDTQQARADSRLVLNIKPDNPKDNVAPQPRPIEDRTVSGQKIRVQVDVFGADPDGDPVVYGGLVEPPKFGRIARSGTNWFEYEPFEGEQNTGTDSFKVLLTDPYGASGIADVRIGVAARSQENQAPAALDDSVFVKPGLTIQYPVLDNDSDPDGDPLIMDPDRFSTPAGVRARLVGTAVEVEVPSLGSKSELNQVAQYSVTDGLGSSSTAVLTVTARKDAPDHAPTALDDVAEAALLKGKRAGDTITVDVLKNDGDIDGAKADLKLSVVGGKTALVSGRKLKITLTKASQVIPYRVADATGQRSFAFVYVAGTDSMPPQLNAEAVPVKVTAGEQKELRLNDLVVVRAGRSPKVSRTDRITASNGDASGSGGTLRFSSPRAYYGPASITLSVIDGVDNNDPEGLESQITIPITVLPAKNVPPTIRSASVVLYAGADPTMIRLDRLATDINEKDDLSFKVSGAAKGVKAKVSGDDLELKAEDGAASSAGSLDIAVTDKKSDPVHGRIRVVVVGAEDAAALAPAMVLRDLRLPDGVKGETLPIDLREAIVFDPFPGKDKEVSNVQVVSGPAATPSVSGTTMRVKPIDAGDVVISYVMSDGSGLPERNITGRIDLVTASEPDAPGKPSAVEGGPDSVQLTWKAPFDGGRPIEKYLVEWNGGTKECTATQCLVEGLDPGSKYRFTVTAVNEIDKSKPSPQSDEVTPDTVPGAMEAPVVVDAFDDRNGQLHLRWTPPQNDGSDITGYVLESVPATKEMTPGAGDTELVWPGLANGTDYQFRIRAVNARGDGLASPLSAPAKPFTKPSVMDPPTLEAQAPNGDGRGYLTVSWPAVVAPADGFDDVATYQVQIFKDGAAAAEKTAPGTATSETFDVDNGHSYTAKIWATNRAGVGAPSAESSADVAWDKASAPSGITKVDDCAGNACKASTSSYRATVSFTTPADNGGYPVAQYSYRTTDGHTGRVNASTTAVSAPATATIAFSSAAANQRVTLTPLTTVPDEGEVAGTEATGGSFDPYAKPFTPTLDYASTDEAGRAVIRINCAGGNGRPVTLVKFSGESTQSWSSCSSTRETVWDPSAPSDPRCVTAHIATAAGNSSESGQWCAKARAKTVTVYYVQTTDVPNADCYRPCYYVKYRVSGFPQGTYSGSAVGFGSGDCASAWTSTWSIRVPSSGSADIATDYANHSSKLWWISSTCDRVDIKVDGTTGSANIP